ncbi:hypothetical protein DJ532_15680, partial [Sulfolobus sp. A20-N-F8]
MDNQKIVFHSEFLASLAKNAEECSVTEIMKEVIYGILYEFGSKRIELHKRIEDLFQRIAEGKITDTSNIISIHSSIITLYSDSSSLYYVVKKLSKFLDKEVEEDCLFAYDRAEILVTRESDLYNIYLTEIQNNLNIIIKKLTSISFIFLPITAIASIYAVSFVNLPSNFMTLNFVYFTIPLVLIGILLTIYLRKIGWL